MKKFVQMLMGVAMVTALFGATPLFGATRGTAPLGVPAAAAEVPATYGAPTRGQTSAAVKALQQRLVRAKVLSAQYVTSYFGPLTEQAVRDFQVQYGLTASGKVDRATWSKLVAVTGTIQLPSRPAGIDSRCMASGRALCIDKTKDKLHYLKAGEVVRTFDARFGCAATRTREGRFSVLWKSRNHVSTIYHTPMPFAMFFSGGQAVHYSADFAARGYAGCSHGCVNIRNRPGIAWVFDQMRVGDRVVIYRS